MMDTTNTPPLADHLCVLLHGLWGNPEHLKYVAESLSDHFGDEKITTLVCESNAGGFTYDGVDVGARRATQEIKDHLKVLSDRGHEIKKFSIVGYSLGGLIARYAIGLLENEGFFETVEPVNFTTFASPHLGARSSLSQWSSHFFNTVGPRIISASGRQLFVLDNFRDTGRPLLAVMADSDSIFMHALAKFQKRTIYANITNDRLAPFYTTSISHTDPYQGDLDKLKFNYVKGYGEVVIDGKDPCRPLNDEELKNLPLDHGSKPHQDRGRKIATVATMVVAAPIFLTGLLASSAVETYRSQGRIRLHILAEGQATYAIRHLTAKTRASLQGTANQVAALSSPVKRKFTCHTRKTTSVDSLDSYQSSDVVTPHHHSKLTLLPSQRAMVDSLDELDVDKFHVYIHNSNWSHAAIIVRDQKPAFDEGRMVIKHWLETQFRT